MIELLEPLAQEPGVELAMLAASDGVPIASCGRVSGQPIDSEFGGMSKDDGLAAMTAAWISELNLAVGPLSWLPPTRISLRAARGTLVLQRMETAILVVLLARGLSPEAVRLSMDATIARIERTLRPRPSPEETPTASGQNNEYPAPMPSDPVEAAMEPRDSWVEANDVVEDTPPAGDY